MILAWWGLSYIGLFLSWQIFARITRIGNLPGPLPNAIYAVASSHHQQHRMIFDILCSHLGARVYNSYQNLLWYPSCFPCLCFFLLARLQLLVGFGNSLMRFPLAFCGCLE